MSGRGTRGADVTVTAARASAAELAATRHVSGVTAAAGPFAEVTGASESQGQPYGQLTLVAVHHRGERSMTWC